MGVGLAIGGATGLLGGGIAWLWQGNPYLGLVLFTAMVLTMSVAGLLGAAVPLLLKALRQDPALGSGVIVTTVTDAFGFLCFLGLATLLLERLT
jgi:magnesium transporter